MGVSIIDGQIPNESKQSNTGKWIIAIIVAAVIGGSTVALISNAGKTSVQIPSPSPVVQQSPSPTSKSGCEIKGNISSSGERIYHMPGQRFYDKTVIDESAGEKWFCTEQDAISAGWRKAKL